MPFVLHCIMYFGVGSLAIGQFWIFSYSLTNYWSPICRLTAVLFMVLCLWALYASQSTDREATIKLACMLFGIITTVCDHLHGLISEKRD